VLILVLILVLIFVGMMGFAVLLAGGVNQMGATTPLPVLLAAGRRLVGVMTCTTTHRPSSRAIMKPTPPACAGSR
jgi:hypothetical protein